MLKETVSLNSFRTGMLRNRTFSAEALEVMFDYYNEFEEDIEFDVLALCADWTEYENYAELNYEESKTLEELQEHTLVYELANGGFLMLNY
tara:strand:+ start:119 stop:391 length:273 start_codon:yes stop_codon:yes gene_type:complete